MIPGNTLITTRLFTYQYAALPVSSDEHVLSLQKVVVGICDYGITSRLERYIISTRYNYDIVVNK